ncbi:hypothetical protein Leryth_020248 [Lithospermum erythrorhizon]|nr:hypothetical protein Leryth_020248 [Lithospermum erythrorhizon]
MSGYTPEEYILRCQPDQLSHGYHKVENTLEVKQDSCAAPLRGLRLQLETRVPSVHIPQKSLLTGSPGSHQAYQL